MHPFSGPFAKLQKVTEFHRVCMSVCVCMRVRTHTRVLAISSWNNLAPAGGVFMKFYVIDFTKMRQ